MAWLTLATEPGLGFDIRGAMDEQIPVLSLVKPP